MIYGADRQHQLGRDLLVRPAIGDQSQDFELALVERLAQRLLGDRTRSRDLVRFDQKLRHVLRTDAPKSTLFFRICSGDTSSRLGAQVRDDPFLDRP